MTKIWKWITSKERTLKKYEEAKREFSKTLGRPVIIIPIELPKELMALKEDFCALEKDEKFLNTMKRTCIRYLKRKHASRASTVK